MRNNYGNMLRRFVAFQYLKRLQGAQHKGHQSAVYVADRNRICGRHTVQDFHLDKRRFAYMACLCGVCFLHHQSCAGYVGNYHLFPQQAAGKVRRVRLTARRRVPGGVTPGTYFFTNGIKGSAHNFRFARERSYAAEARFSANKPQADCEKLNIFVKPPQNS